MRIFLTGATGYIGAAVLDALLRAGHDVTALVRNNEKAKGVANRGGHPVIGDLADPESYRAAAEAQDGYVHTAFDSRSGRGAAIDRAVVDMMLEAARRPRTAGSNAPAQRFIIYTSGVWVLGPTPDPATEEAPINPVGHVSWRPTHEEMIIDANSGALRTIAVRPGLVYAGGDRIVGAMFRSANKGPAPGLR